MADQSQAMQAPIQQTVQKTLELGDYLPPPMLTDGFYSIRMIGDTIRITIFSYAAAANEQPKPIITGTIAMSLPAFLKSAEAMEDYIKNLEQAGVIKKS